MTTDGKVMKVAMVLAALFGMGLGGCAQYMAMVREQNMAQAGREEAMRKAARVEDGHVYLDDGHSSPYNAMHSLPAGTAWKTCLRLTRYQLEPGEPRAAMSYQGSLAGTVQPLIDQGALPADRFYVGAGSEQFIVSVPASERAELARNMEEGAICIWVAGKPKEFPCTPERQFCAVYYAPLEKWDGVLRHGGGDPAPGGAGPTGSPPPGTGGGTTGGDGANAPGSTSTDSPPTAANPLLGTWRSDKVQSVTMEFRADEFRWMAMISTIRKVRYEVDGANVLVIQTEGGGQIERFRVIDANHMVHVQAGVGELPFTRIAGSGQ